MIPIGRPFLDYVLSALADAGLAEVCLVIGPEHGAVREYYGGVARLTRVRVAFAVQEKPLGTRRRGGGRRPHGRIARFPRAELRQLLPRGGVPLGRSRARRPGASWPSSATDDPRQQRAGGIVSASSRWCGSATTSRLLTFVEKPDAATLAAFGSEVYLSMNCWRFDSSVARRVPARAALGAGRARTDDAVRLARHEAGTRFAWCG